MREISLVVLPMDVSKRETLVELTVTRLTSCPSNHLYCPLKLAGGRQILPLALYSGVGRYVSTNSCFRTLTPYRYDFLR